LLGEDGTGSYLMHDLVREFAAERAAEQPDEQAGATARVADFYVVTACEAAAMMEPGRMRLDPPAPAAGVVAVRHADAGDALAWFAEHRSALLGELAQVVSVGLDGHAWRLSWAVCSYLQRAQHEVDAIPVWRTGLAAAERVQDDEGMARMHQGLGSALLTGTEAWQEALVHLEAAVELYLRVGLRDGAARATAYIALLQYRMGDHAAEEDHYRAALELAESRAVRMMILNNLAVQQAERGDAELAVTMAREAIDWFKEIGDLHGMASAVDTVGLALNAVQDHEGAVRAFRESVTLFQDIGGHLDAGLGLINLGDALLEAGDPVAARDAWVEALHGLEELGHRSAETAAERLSTC
jgi:tetratricopeptide (TPR) repeat protein